MKFIGGVDISYAKNSSKAIAMLVVMSFPSLEIVYSDSMFLEIDVEYTSGFLAEREAPIILELIQKLRNRHCEPLPQVLFVDGNGTLHPRGYGLACHIGEQLDDISTIGVAKSFLQFEEKGLTSINVRKMCAEKLTKGGEFLYLKKLSGEIVGAALRPLDSTTNPIYVSPGHKIDLSEALKLTIECCKFRVPEPIRQADLLSRALLRAK